VDEVCPDGYLGSSWTVLGSISILNPTSEKIKFNLLQKFTQFVNTFYKLITICWRQSWPYKWKLLGIFEVLISLLICLYENSITVNVVVPLVPKPFLSTIDLYNHNYTFSIPELNLLTLNSWLSDKYNKTNHQRVIKAEEFSYLDNWLVRYFLNHENDVKYAIVGYLNFHFHYQAVKFVKEKNDTCYQIFPIEKAFSPHPFYFHFTSALASSLHTGVSRLRAAG